MSRAYLRWVPALAWYGVISWLSHQPQWPVPARQYPDWLLHVAGYGLLGAFLAIGAGRRRVQTIGWFVALLTIGVLAGALDELHQSIVPGRDPSVGDIVADGLGVLVGLLSCLGASFAGLWGLWEDRRSA